MQAAQRDGQERVHIGLLGGAFPALRPDMLAARWRPRRAPGAPACCASGLRTRPACSLLLVCFAAVYPP